MKDSPEILPLTGLRFIAAFYVFLFHIHIRWPLSTNDFVRSILDQGAIGMSLFFMLSGFVLVYRYADESSTKRNYFINRFARIYPVYLVAALVTLPWIGISIANDSLIKDVGRLILLITANIFLMQAWFIQFFNFWNDGGSWSISVEAFCYLLLPFILPALCRLELKRIQLLIAICYILAIFPGISAKLFDTPAIGIFYSMPIYRLPEFLIGAALYLVIRAGISYRFATWPQLLTLACFSLYLGRFGGAMPIYVGHNWVALPVIAFMIFSLANNRGILASLLGSKLFVWLGSISYCFYSFQALLVLVLISKHHKLVEIAPIFSNNLVLALSSLVALIFLSATGYYLIEEPTRKWIRRKYGH